LNKLSKVVLRPKEILKFNRVVYSKVNYKTKPPPNIYLARVSDLINVGGYNESFCGNYGYEDKELMHRLKMNGFKETISKDVTVKTKADLHTKNLNRDLTVNKKRYLEIIKPK
jgi:predicted glycosyltransferase involved in capsule biosynthesis